MNTFKLILGDWSGDGHRQTSSRTIQTDLTRDEVCAAVAKAQVELGLGSMPRRVYKEAELLVASEYEDANAPSAEVRAALGFEFSEPEFREPEDTYMTDDDFVDLWLRIARRGARPDAVLELAPEAPSICIGGYGLFFS